MLHLFYSLGTGANMDGCQWEYEKAQVFLVDMRKELLNPNLHSYVLVYVFLTHGISIPLNTNKLQNCCLGPKARRIEYLATQQFKPEMLSTDLL
jgi:hypothetical protein